MTMFYQIKKASIWTLSLSLILSAPGMTSAQQSHPMDATQIIFALHNGALLVRLHSKAMAVAAFEKAGRHDMAVYIAREQDDENKAIMHAFQSHFSFCKVYFFPSDSSGNVLQGKRSGYFLNEKLQVDPSITVKENFFITGEHGDPDFPSHDVDSTQSSAPDAGLISDALVLMDDHFRQLPKPFPYYVRPGMADGKYPWDKRVQRLNDNLKNFLGRFQ